MSDEDATKELPRVPDTEPTMYTVMERLNGLDEHLTRRLTNMDDRLTNMDDRLTNMDDRLTNMQESADLRHSETLERFKSIDSQIEALRTDTRNQGHAMDILNNHILRTQANQKDLNERIAVLEEAS